MESLNGIEYLIRKLARELQEHRANAAVRHLTAAERHYRAAERLMGNPARMDRELQRARAAVEKGAREVMAARRQSGTRGR
ncbi:hypothetical protein [Amycolatopsis antarctica]|nr:hypothetical protein [Amycolatopsis antarctica]